MDESVRGRDVLAAAIGFATRLPVGWLGTPGAEAYVRARSLLPLSGALVGSFGAAVSVIAMRALHDASLAAMLAVGATVALTGALHEDGLADVCDGLGGGADRERVLAILRDSRLGTFGVVGLVTTLALRVRLLSLLLDRSSPVAAVAWLVAGHVVARAAAVFAMDRHPYARPTDGNTHGTVITRPFSWLERATYLLPCAVVGLVPDDPRISAVAVVAAFSIAFVLGRRMERWLGGVSGDCLGAIEQAAEVAVALVAVAGSTR